MTAVLPLPDEQPTVPLWPTAGRALGLSKNSTYQAARRGEIPGLLTFGARRVVATAALRRILGLDTGNDEAGPSEGPATPHNIDPTVTTTRSRRNGTPPA